MHYTTNNRQSALSRWHARLECPPKAGLTATMASVRPCLYAGRALLRQIAHVAYLGLAIVALRLRMAIIKLRLSIILLRRVAWAVCRGRN